MNRRYLDIQRSDDIVMIHIAASKTRRTTTKQAFYRAIADHLARNPGVRPEGADHPLSE
jgi:hypothetical protein